MGGASASSEGLAGEVQDPRGRAEHFPALVDLPPSHASHAAADLRCEPIMRTQYTTIAIPSPTNHA
jgi:hypothetical protein